MLGRDSICRLIPHSGTMCLLDGVRHWSADHIAAWTRSHAEPANPLRRDGRLSSLCAAEYALQAAALHGALLAGGRPTAPGRLAALRIDRIAAGPLDTPSIASLEIEAWLELLQPEGLIYRFSVSSDAGVPVLEGRGVLVLSPGGCASS